jgi:rare lipoprotein A
MLSNLAGQAETASASRAHHRYGRAILGSAGAVHRLIPHGPMASRGRISQTAGLVAVATLLSGAAGVSAPASSAGRDISLNPPQPGQAMRVSATAYCIGGRTRSGVKARQGIVAADPAVLPVGSVIRIEAPAGALEGVYSVLDTGPAVKGRELDIFMSDCTRAEKFGRQPVHIRVLRLGWSPKQSAD